MVPDLGQIRGLKKTQIWGGSMGGVRCGPFPSGMPQKWSQIWGTDVTQNRPKFGVVPESTQGVRMGVGVPNLGWFYGGSEMWTLPQWVASKVVPNLGH